MIVTTGGIIPGAEIEQILGVVRGVVIRTMWDDTQVQVKSGLFGGVQITNTEDAKSFDETCDEARQHAYDIMVKHAERLGTDAIIGMHYDSAQVSRTRTEILAYGTAVKLRF